MKKKHTARNATCAEIFFEDPYTGFSLYADKDSAMEAVQEYSWIDHEGKWYCPSCYEYDINEEVVIKQGG